MTFEEALNAPFGMSLGEYQKLLDEKKKLEKQISNASADIDFEIDSLEVLSDEVGSDRYNKHVQNKQKAEAKREKAQTKLKSIMEVLQQ